MRSPEAENRHLQSSDRTVWVFAVLGVMIVVGLVVWMTSDPTNRMASPGASTIGSASKSPPASSHTDPATQSASVEHAAEHADSSAIRSGL